MVLDARTVTTAPHLTREQSDLSEVLAGFLGCAVEDRQAVYVSVPITTGRRFVDWRRGPGAGLADDSSEYQRQLRAHVIEPNVQAAAPIVRALRERSDGVVIDPTAVDDVPGWEQSDYHDLWARVIERYASTVVFASGWEFSTGCVHELATALRVGAAILDQDLLPMPPETAARRVRRALDDIADGVLPAAPLRRALDALIGAQQGGHHTDVEV